MNRIKTRSIEAIEERMEGVEEGSLRYQILNSAKTFKTSWIDLGQALYSVWKNKIYKEWGYLTFDAYAAKEIGIRKQTALKLLKSYYFLEKEEPAYLDKDRISAQAPAAIPSYEAVDLLRLAKNKKELDRSDYINLRKSVLDMGRDAKEVKRDLTAVIKQREALTPDETREKKRVATIRRFLAILKSLKRDLEISKILPSGILKDADSLIRKIESEIT